MEKKKSEINRCVILDEPYASEGNKDKITDDWYKTINKRLVGDTPIINISSRVFIDDKKEE